MATTKENNGKFSKAAVTLLGALALAWIIAVSTGLIRAEVREARLCAVEKVVEKLSSSVEQLGTIRDDLKDIARKIRHDRDGGHQ